MHVQTARLPAATRNENWIIVAFGYILCSYFCSDTDQNYGTGGGAMGPFKCYLYQVLAGLGYLSTRWVDATGAL
jgi:hypothetical protein